jgi:hypothetical protein
MSRIVILKGMTGALAPFSYLVYNNSQFDKSRTSTFNLFWALRITTTNHFFEKGKKIVKGKRP